MKMARVPCVFMGTIILQLRVSGHLVENKWKWLTHYDTYCWQLWKGKKEVLLCGSSSNQKRRKKCVFHVKNLSDVSGSKIAGDSNHLICPLYLVVNSISSWWMRFWSHTSGYQGLSKQTFTYLQMNFKARLKAVCILRLNMGSDIKGHDVLKTVMVLIAVAADH